MNIKLGTEICCVGFEIKWCLKSRIYLSFLLQIHLFNWKFQVPLEGFRALQGISGPQRFQINKAYGAPERLPSAHTWLVLQATWCMNFSAYYFFFNFFDGHSSNGCQKIDACVAIYYKKKKKKKKIKKDSALTVFIILYLQFQPTGSSWVFYQRTASRAIAACHPWSQWRIWLWLIWPPEWLNYTSEVGKLSLTGSVQVTYTFSSEIEFFCSFMYLFGNFLYCCQLYMFSVS